MTGSPLAQQSCHGYSNSRPLKPVIRYIYEISNTFQSALSTLQTYIKADGAELQE